MAKYNYIQTNFKTGEISPKAMFAIDDERYATSVEEMRNLVVDYDGAAWMRPGTQYLGKEIESDGVNSRAIASDTKVFPFYVTNPYTGAALQFHVFLKRATGSEVAGVSLVAEYTRQTDVYFGDYNTTLGYSGNVSNTTNFPNWDYPEIITKPKRHFSFVQAGNTLFITAGHVQPMFVRVLFDPTNLSAVPSFSYGPLWSGSLGDSSVPNVYQRLPYFLNSNTEIVFEPSGTTGTITIGVRNLADTADVNYFSTGHVGAVFKMNAGAFVITSVTNAYTATAAVLNNLSSTTRSSQWEESCWSNARGWPESVDYWNNRLVFGGTSSQPDTLWFSETDDVSQFSDPIGASSTAASPFSVTISQQKPWPIRWLASTSGKLFIGTAKSEYTCSSADSTSGFSASNISIQKESEFGSIPHQAMIYNNSVLFMDQSGKKLRQLIFDDLKRVYDGIEVAVFSEFAFDRTKEDAEDTTNEIEADILNIPTIIRIQNMGPFKTVWVTRAGALFSFTINNQRKVSALSHHYLGGEPISGFNYVPVYDISVGQTQNSNAIPRADIEHLFMITGRSINDTDVVYAERMGSIFDWYNMEFNAGLYFFTSNFYFPELFPSHLDCHFYQNIGGVDYLFDKAVHLKSESVYAMADGFQYGPYTVNGSGQIDFEPDLDVEPEFVIAGFRYTARIRSLAIEAGSQIGSNKGSKTKIDTAFVQLFKTVGMKIGYLWKGLNSTLEDIDFTDPNGLAGTPIPLFTGNKKIEIPGASPDEKNQIVIEHVGPYPFCCCGIVYRGQTYD